MTKKTKQNITPSAGGHKTKTQSPSEQGAQLPKEIGGRKQGLEPTRYGDWEKNGRCIDF